MKMQVKMKVKLKVQTKTEVMVEVKNKLSIKFVKACDLVKREVYKTFLLIFYTYETS